MEEKATKTGIDPIGDVPWGTHLCQFYQSKEDLLDILVPYFKAGLENNEFCIWVTSEPLREKEATKAMRKAVPHFDRYLKKGQIEIVPHTQWYLGESTFNLQRVLNAWIDKLNQALVKGYDGIRVTGNTAWLKKRDWRNFADYEERANSAIGKYQMIAICSYCLDRCGPSELIDVVDNHQFALIRREGEWELLESSEIDTFVKQVPVALQRLQAGEALRSSEELLRILFEFSPGGIYLNDLKGVFIDGNKAVGELIGYKREELIGKNFLKLGLVPPGQMLKAVASLAKNLLGKPTGPDEFILNRKDGKQVTVEIRTYPIKIKDKSLVLGIARDVTERKKVEIALESEKNHLEALFRGIPQGIVAADLNHKIRAVNPAFTKMFGHTLEKVRGKDIDEIVVPKEKLSEARRITQQCDEGKISTVETVRKRKDGSFIPVEISGVPIIVHHKRVGLYVIYKDISGRKKAEEKLRESEQKFRTLAEWSPNMIFINKNGTVMYANKKCEEITGYQRDELYSPDFDFFTLIAPESRESVKTSFNKHIEGEEIEPYECTLITKDGKRIAGINSTKLITYQRENVILRIVADVTELRWTERERRQNLEKLQKALEATVNALASTVEARDPYTAGHQRRVTQLACAIAEEMGLSEKRVRGLQMAAAIHDIGKINVPHEILSKPSSLTGPELAMIKAHPKVGHHILKNIEFPWPVAEIVLQHHERMDRSGYPQGLSADIMLEARILGVADVVEAMSSHRPYRPAHSIDKALEEISKNKGILYDRDVVDACLKLFTEKGFTFK